MAERQREPRLDLRSSRFSTLRRIDDDTFEVDVQAFIAQVDTNQQEAVTYDYIVGGGTQISSRPVRNNMANAVLRIPADQDQVLVTLRLEWVHGEKIYELEDIDLRPEKKRVRASLEERWARNPKKWMAWLNLTVVVIFIIMALAVLL